MTDDLAGLWAEDDRVRRECNLARGALPDEENDVVLNTRDRRNEAGGVREVMEELNWDEGVGARGKGGIMLTSPRLQSRAKYVYLYL